MEAEVITKFLPSLITAISDCVQSVSDQCLAKGLIPESVYKRVLESGGTSEDKARTLVLAVKKSTETDSRCLEILLSILERELPFTIREKLLSEIRKEPVEKANTCRAVVPSLQTVQSVPSEELPRESALVQTTLLGKFEDSIRQHERACAEKRELEEKLTAKSEEHERLKQEFVAFKSQSEKANSVQSSKISDCEYEIETLKARLTQLEHNVEEQGMKVKRGRNTVMLKTGKMLATVIQQSNTAAWEKANEMLKAKEREVTVTIQEKDLRIKELELELKQKQPVDEIPSDILKAIDMTTLSESIESISSKHDWSLRWRDLGLQLGFTTDELDKISKECMSYSRPLCGMLRDWTQWYPGDGRGSTKFPSYTGLHSALVRIGAGDVISSLPSYNEIIQERMKREITLLPPMSPN
jgi:hypothetical protein